MKARIIENSIRRFLFVGLFSLCIAVVVTGQTLQSIHNAVERGRSSSSSSSPQWALDNLTAHWNQRCASGTGYVVKVFANGRYHSTAYYCDNERSVLNAVYNALAGSPFFSLEVIDNSSSGSGNPSSAAAVEAEKQRQAEIERQKEKERLEQQQKFDASKQELLADLKGMSQEVTKPLELLGGDQTPTNSMGLIGMKQTSPGSLEFIGTPSNTSSSNVVIDDTNGLPSVDYRPSGIIMPETKISISEKTIPPDNVKHILGNNEIGYTHPYIELAAGTAKAIIGLVGTAEAVVAIPTVNIWKENIKAWRDFQDYGKIPSTKEILYNAFWGKDGEVPKEVLGEFAGGLVSDGVLKLGKMYAVKNAGKYGITPLRAVKILTRSNDTANVVQTGWEESKAWSAQIGEDYIIKPQQNK